MTCGDNINSVHFMVNLPESTNDVAVAYCKRCKHKFIVKVKDRRQYNKIFKRDTLQRHENLYYKEYSKNLNLA